MAEEDISFHFRLKTKDMKQKTSCYDSTCKYASSSCVTGGTAISAVDLNICALKARITRYKSIVRERKEKMQ